MVRTGACATCGGDGKVAADAVRGVRGRRRRPGRASASRSTSRPASPTASASACPAAATRASPARPAGDLFVQVRVREDERFLRDGDDLVTVVDVPAPRAALGTTVAGADPRRASTSWRSPPARSRARSRPSAARACRRCGAAGRATCASSSTSPSRASSPRTSGASSRQLADSFSDDAFASDEGLLGKLRRARGVDPPRPCGCAATTAASSSPSCSSSRPPGWRRASSPTASSTSSTARRASCPRCPRSQAAAGDVLVEVSSTEIADDWDERWKQWHRPVAIGPLRVRPPWEPAPSTGSTSSSTPARRSGPAAHATTRLCLELLLELEPGGAVRRLGLRLRRARDRGGQARLRPVAAVDYDPLAVDATRVNAGVNGVALEVGAGQPARAAGPAAPTVCANLLRPLLLEVAAGARRGARSG